MSKWNYCTWPLANGQDCGRAIPPSETYCTEHEQESRAWAEDERDMQQIKREWDAAAHEGDESPPWKQPDPQEVIIHLLQENTRLRREHDELYQLIAKAIMRPDYPWREDDPFRQWIEKHPRKL